ncbi:MAG: sulfite exporter TauE/SafE family protein [Gemmatimonadales bacterium]|nr:sulfite exporter TauE/SafE family protein [Gemmatimonadales bacterium]
MSVWGVIAFVGVGFSLGLLGGGGAILAVPVLVHLFAIPITMAVPMSLPVVGTAAAVGAFARWRQGHLRLRAAALFAVFAMTAAFAAARLGAGIGDQPRTILLAVVMLAAATAMWLRSRGGPANAPGAPVATPRPVVVIPAAIVVGTLTGLVGVGGGFLIVPALTGFMGVAMAEATATSLAVIALNTAAAGAGYIGRVHFDPLLTAVVTIAALVGMVAGTLLAPRIRAATLSRVFALLLVLVGTFMLWQDLKR